VKFVTYNIQFGVGRDARTNLDRIASTVSGADVIALQEVTRAWPRAADGDQPQQLAERLAGYHWVYGPSVNVPHPGAATDASRRGARQQFGNMLLSRTPIVASRVHPLPRHETLDIPRVALEGVIDTPASGLLRVYSVHLAYKVETERAAQVQALFDLHRTAWGSESHITPLPVGPSVDVPATPQNALILGDFNMVRSEPAYQVMLGAAGRSFADIWVAAGNDPNTGVTMPANPDTETWADSYLDYGFLSTALADHIVSARIDSDADGSDHQPVWFDINL
jgi:endonuclease/exonuclease/phosphatase family metal-dependent hydrolase